MTAAQLQTSEERRGTWWPLPLLLTVILIVFARATTAGFIDLDDELYVLNNPHVLQGLTADDLEWACRTTLGGNWHPLTWWSLQLDATLTTPPPALPPGSFGPPPRPSAVVYHVDNLIQHLLAAALLYLFLERATRRRWASFFVALLWAVHPLRVESVVWVTERKDTLAGVFGFLALYLYVRWTECKSWKWGAAVAAAMLCSLLSKPLFVTFPVLTLLLDVWPLQRLTAWRQLPARLREKAGLFLIVLMTAGGAMLAQQSAHAMQSFANAGLAARLENALISYVRYLWMQVSFVRLAIFYPYLGRAAIWEVGGALALLAGLTGLAIRWRKECPWVLVGWLWYLVSLVPMIGIIQVGEQAYADRYTYLPTVGLLMIVIYSMPQAWFTAPRQRQRVFRGLGVAAAVLAGFTMWQIGFWQDPLRLDERAIEVTRSNYTIYSTMGAAFMREGRPDLAMRAYQEALRINPDFQNALVGMGALLLTAHQPAAATVPLGRAAANALDDPLPHNLDGIALASSGRLTEAIEQFQIAARLAPEDVGIRKNLEHAVAQASAGTRP